MINMLMVVQEAAVAVETVTTLGDGLALIGVGLAIGLAVIGAGLGLGRIGGQVAEAIARQPEAVGDIRGAALLVAFLLEGATIVAIIIALVAKLI